MNFQADPVKNLAIAGSCVSRDCIELLDLTRTAIARYTARHSLISRGTDLSHLIPENHGITSAFQERAIREDLAGTGFDTLVSESRDAQVILWDLADERGGVFEVIGPDATARYATRSFDIERNASIKKALLSAGARHIAFGSDEHFDLWRPSAEAAVGTLRENSLLERTILIAAPWAEKTRAGEPTPESFGIGAARANELFARYHEFLRSLGVQMVTPPAETVIADPAHVWGVAPFHFVPEFYAAILHEVEKALGVTFFRKGGSDATPAHEEPTA